MNKKTKHAYIGPTSIKKPPIGAIEQLVTGHTFFHPEMTDEHLFVFYKKCRKFIMSFIGTPARDIEPNFFPCGATGVPVPWGFRPWGWWRFDAPEPRKLLLGDPGLAMPERGLWFGVPNFYAGASEHAQLVYETQTAYLERLGLLLPGEKEKIAF